MNSLVAVLGFDVGGANTKAALISVQHGKVKQVKVAVEYFPVWKQPQQLVTTLLTLKKRLGIDRLDALGVTMTAELSDAYATKREGIHQILDSVKTAFPDSPIYALNTDAKTIPIKTAEANPLSLAAANWAATGWLVAQRLRNCVVVDVGSTSASIIPIVKGQIAALGKTDMEKLMCGELVYTGSLRTNVATIVHYVPMRSGVCGVSSELFALSGDVHLVLGNISEAQYTSETADGRGKSLPEAQARLARVVCADMEMLTPQEIMDVARYIYREQISQIAEGLSKVYAYTEKHSDGKVSVVVTGLGKDFIAKKAAQQIGASEIVDLSTLVPPGVAIATPAFGVAVMTASILKGETVEWTPP